MKKTLAIILVLAMMLSMSLALTGCAKSGDAEAQDETPAAVSAADNETEPAAETEPAIEEAEPAVEETEPAADEAEPADESFDTDSWDAVTLTVSTSNNETDPASQCLAYLCDLITERSDGKIRFQIFYGGTYCSMPEEYDYVASGALDMIQWNQSFNSDAFPLLAMSLLNVGSEQALELVNYLCFENEETAAIYQQVTHDGNVEVLGYIPAGYSGFYSRVPVTGWDSFSDITFGTMLNANLWTAMGMNVVSCSPADMYESLSRGTIDSCGQALSAAISRMFYEVADYGLVTGYSAVAYGFTMNLDRWNSFNADQQALIRQCVEEAQAYSIDLYDASMDEWINTWETETGVPMAHMSDEDNWDYMYTAYPINYETYLTFVQNLGQDDIFETWVDATSDYLGFDCRTGAHQ